MGWNRATNSAHPGLGLPIFSIEMEIDSGNGPFQLPMHQVGFICRFANGLWWWDDCTDSDPWLNPRSDGETQLGPHLHFAHEGQGHSLLKVIYGCVGVEDLDDLEQDTVRSQTAPATGRRPGEGDGRQQRPVTPGGASNPHKHTSMTVPAGHMSAACKGLELGCARC